LLLLLLVVMVVMVGTGEVFIQFGEQA